MERIRVKVAITDEQHMLHDIVEGAVSRDATMEVVPLEAPAGSTDVLLVHPIREERDVLETGGKVLALDRRNEYVNLYVMRKYKRIRVSSQLADAIQKLVRPMWAPFGDAIRKLSNFLMRRSA